MAKISPHKTLYARLPVELHEALEFLAQRDKRSISLETEFILDQYIRQNLPDYDPQPKTKAQSKTVKVSNELAAELRRRDTLAESGDVADLDDDEAADRLTSFIDSLYTKVS